MTRTRASVRKLVKSFGVNNVLKVQKTYHQHFCIGRKVRAFHRHHRHPSSPPEKDAVTMGDDGDDNLQALFKDDDAPSGARLSPEGHVETCRP
jgi:hypothetical protein